jgi:hypothetical protein
MWLTTWPAHAPNDFTATREGTSPGEDDGNLIFERSQPPSKADV